MKRSEINQLLSSAKEFFRARQFCLPPFAHWAPNDWRAAGAAPLVQAQLGWDVTDFGSGDFYRQGLLLFTLRNGQAGNQDLWAKDYAEKIMVVREGQVTPTHFHHYKMEDIINRGGGTLVVQLWQSDTAQGLSPAPVRVRTDGWERELPAGGTLELQPGESVCLPPRLYHQFWGKPGHGQVLVGEVSRANDDHTDNYFYHPVGRFPTVAEDEPPLHLLVGDYASWAGH
jgi:hypothetical protein